MADDRFGRPVRRGCAALAAGPGAAGARRTL